MCVREKRGVFGLLISGFKLEFADRKDIWIGELGLPAAGIFSGVEFASQF
jgi:hypothetical protein